MVGIAVTAMCKGMARCHEQCVKEQQSCLPLKFPLTETYDRAGFGPQAIVSQPLPYSHIAPPNLIELPVTQVDEKVRKRLSLIRICQTKTVLGRDTEGATEGISFS